MLEVEENHSWLDCIVCRLYIRNKEWVEISLHLCTAMFPCLLSELREESGPRDEDGMGGEENLPAAWKNFELVGFLPFCAELLVVAVWPLMQSEQRFSLLSSLATEVFFSLCPGLYQ